MLVSPICVNLKDRKNPKQIGIYDVFILLIILKERYVAAEL